MTESISISSLKQKIDKFIEENPDCDHPVYFDCLAISGNFNVGKDRNGNNYIEMY